MAAQLDDTNLALGVRTNNGKVAGGQHGSVVGVHTKVAVVLFGRGGRAVIVGNQAPRQQ
jgi:hypothetical protein